jgi:hypothetical protein
MKALHGCRPGVDARIGFLAEYSFGWYLDCAALDSEEVQSTPIRFCPWCGTELAKRRTWFARLLARLRGRS